MKIVFDQLSNVLFLAQGSHALPMDRLEVGKPIP